MNEWAELFKRSGLREMIVKDGTTGEIVYWGVREK